MPQWLIILLIVLGGLLTIWLLLLAINLIFVGSFSTIFKHHKKAIVVILYTKLENMKKLLSILNQNGVKYDAKISNTLYNINSEDFNEPGSEQFDKSKKALSYVKDEIMFVTNENQDLSQDPEFITYKNNVNDADTQYRNNVIMYNADVLGYNYWIRFLPCRFIFKMFKVKRKEIIS